MVQENIVRINFYHPKISPGGHQKATLQSSCWELNVILAKLFVGCVYLQLLENVSLRAVNCRKLMQPFFCIHVGWI